MGPSAGRTWGASDCRMNTIAVDPAQPYRRLIAAYTDAIRQSDFKANIAILMVAFMMGPVLGNSRALPTICRSPSSCCRS